MKFRPYARILIDGMDGSGKTTLADQLMEFLGDNGHLIVGYNRDHTPGKSPMPTWWMEKLAENPMEKVVVHDRFFYPEFVYGPVLRNKMDMPVAVRKYVQEFLRKYAFLIYCRPPAQIIDRDSKTNDQMIGVHEKFKDLLIAYDKLMLEEAPHYNGNFMKYDWTEGIQPLLKRVMRYIYV